ncbi:PP2C family serine/threonine-protein phosphatase [Streptomyces microflavus]|uniref:mucin-2 n=1 Tax=Streptomyces microflavus TaxID=1919 RepID=UPI003808702E
MRSYATAQHPGTDPGQCDVTAVHTAPSGARAYVLLDGIGRRSSTREWAITAARRLARAASRRADAGAGLRHVYNGYAQERFEYGSAGMPKAAAVVVVTVPGKDMTVAWCGDSRAYLLTRGITRRLTQDHNKRRVYPPCQLYPYGGNRNAITSCLGSTATDDVARSLHNHPAIETTRVTLDGPCRLLLASDGAYEPHEDARHDLYAELDDDPLSQVAREFVDLAVDTAIKTSRALDPNQVYADNATVLVADLCP